MKKDKIEQTSQPLKLRTWGETFVLTYTTLILFSALVVLILAPALCIHYLVPVYSLWNICLFVIIVEFMLKWSHKFASMKISADKKLADALSEKEE